MRENNFYYKGRIFESEEDFLNFSIRWHETCVNEESLTEMLDTFKKDILLNIRDEIGIKNGSMNRILERAFFDAMKLRENLRECQKKE